jgi:hypothetical protein
MNETFSNTTRIPSRMGTSIGALFAFVCILFGIIGDSLIVIVILRKKVLRNNLTNIFIVSLQLNDLINICFNQFLVGYAYIVMGWPFHPYFCKLFVYTSIICTGSLIWHHALISIHRYLVVVCNQTTSYMGMSPKVYVLSSLIVARLIPTLVCLPAFINGEMAVYSAAAVRCILAPLVSGVQSLLIVVINMMIPCLIIIFCFARIFFTVHNVSKTVRKRANSSVPSSHSSSFHQQHPQAKKKSSLIDKNSSIHREIQITKMFAIIFVVFLFGYLPYGIIRGADKRNNLHPDIYVLLTVFFIISISVSPIIYGLMNTQVRKECKSVINVILQNKNKK